MPWLPTMTLVLVTIVGGGAAALWLLSGWADQHVSGMTTSEASAFRLDVLKTALTVAVGFGAGVTLLVALRRQAISERAQRFTEGDAQEQRITTLYSAAVEQLGSDKAAVRLGGLYALQRLGRTFPDLRQTVINVICAYLRMPFEVPTADSDDQSEELLVRTTAQDMLTRHTFTAETSTAWPPEPPDLSEPDFWPDLELDLTGATLVDFHMQGRVKNATFSKARFVGGINFAHADFDEHVYFTSQHQGLKPDLVT